MNKKREGVIPRKRVWEKDFASRRKETGILMRLGGKGRQSKGGGSFATEGRIFRKEKWRSLPKGVSEDLSQKEEEIDRGELPLG